MLCVGGISEWKKKNTFVVAMFMKNHTHIFNPKAWWSDENNIWPHDGSIPSVQPRVGFPLYLLRFGIATDRVRACAGACGVLFLHPQVRVLPMTVIAHRPDSSRWWKRTTTIKANAWKGPILHSCAQQLRCCTINWWEQRSNAPICW